MFRSLQFVLSKGIKIPIFLYIVFLSFPLYSQSRKFHIPSYKEGKTLVQNYLSRRFPLKKKDLMILEYPPGKRILKKIYKNQIVYYYHYKIRIPIFRRKKESYQSTKIFREEELWFRIHPEKPMEWKVTFLREDLLPGKWVRYVK